MPESQQEKIHLRIKFLREELELSQNEFAAKVGISSQSNLSAIESGRRNAGDKLLKDISKSLNISLDWLKYGVGEMRKSGQQKEESIELKPKRIPFYDAEAEGGLAGADVSAISAPAGTIDIGDLLQDSEAAIRIYGNSMLPGYPPGCVVGLIPRSGMFFEPGEVYVVETRDGRMLKRLFYKDDDPNSDYITCYSDNIMMFQGGPRDGKLSYPPFDLPKSEITRLFTVTGVVKRNTTSAIVNRYN